MRKNSLARVAAFAAAALVGGLVPALGVASASAATVDPTAVTIDAPTNVGAVRNGSATFTGTLSPFAAGNTLGHGVYASISGPDANPTPADAVTACTVTAPTFSCTITNGGTAGVDTITFFYDLAGTDTDGSGPVLASLRSGDPSATGTMTVGGVVNSVTVTPATAHVAVAGFQAFTVSAFDASSRAVSGASLIITAAEGSGATAVPASQLDVTGTKPADGAIFTGTGTDTATVATSSGQTVTTVKGQTVVYVASKVAGAVTVTVKPVGVSAVQDTAVLTVDAAGANDVTDVTVVPTVASASPLANAFTGKTVELTITLKNAQLDLVSGVTPVVSITGPNASQPVTLVSNGAFGTTTDGNGIIKATYTAVAAGTDVVTAFVNQDKILPITGGLDPSEPRGTANVIVAAEPDFAAPGGLSDNGPFVKTLAQTTATITFSLKTKTGATTTNPAVGYTLNFTLPTAAAAKYSIAPATGVTNGSGNVSVIVTNASPAAGDSVVVTSTLAGDAVITDAAKVSWRAVSSAPTGVIIAPAVNTQSTKGSTTHTVTTLDQFGDPISGLTYTWTVSGRNAAVASATGSTFTYTDTGSAFTGGTDTVTVTAAGTGAPSTTTATANQYWVVGNAKAAQINIDLDLETVGTYAAAPPYAPSLFDKTASHGVSSDATATAADVQKVSVKLIDSSGQKLLGKTVNLTSTGVGVFTDLNGKAIGTSTTAVVSDVSGSGIFDFATAYVRSNAAGTQTITATVDGIADTATVTYTGQYVPMTPVRVLDSRIGQGTLTSNNGNAVMGGRLAPNTVYTFDYDSSALPQGAAYAFNVTAIHPNRLGNLRVAPGNTVGVPPTSLVNYQVGKDVANFITVPNGSRSLRIYSDTASVAVAIDVVGYYPDADGINSVTPSRVANITPVAGGTSHSFQIGGNGGIPMGATAVALNVTAVNPSGLGNLRVYPDGAGVPVASNVNYILHQDKSAFVIIKLPANGKIDVFSDGGSAGVAIDAFAFFSDTNNLVTSAPLRITPVAGVSLAANVGRSIAVAGKAGVPNDAQAVLVSVTSIHNASSTGIGNLRVYPTAGAVPVVSTLNYVSKTSDVANFAIVKLGMNGEITLYSDGSPINVAVDVLGYVPAGK